MVTHVMSIDLIPPDAIAAMRLRATIDELCAQNAALDVSVGPTNEIILHSVSEFRLEMMVDYLKRSKGLDFRAGAPQVRYLERITKTIEWDYTHKKQTRGAGEYAKVKIRVEPGEPGSGFVFRNASRGEIPSAFVPIVEKALASESRHGPVAGFPLIDLACTLIDGGYHDIDSTERSFEVAARACLREALTKVSPRVLEPIMYVIVLTPPEHMGDVVGDLNSRRGQVQGMEERGEMHEITALVPCGSLFGYQNVLLSMTRGSAQFMMTFHSYEPVPPYRPDDGGDTFPPAIGMRA